jgi:hypothetical protein
MRSHSSANASGVYPGLSSTQVMRAHLSSVIEQYSLDAKAMWQTLVKTRLMTGWAFTSHFLFLSIYAKPDPLMVAEVQTSQSLYVLEKDVR